MAEVILYRGIRGDVNMLGRLQSFANFYWYGLGNVSINVSIICLFFKHVTTLHLHNICLPNCIETMIWMNYIFKFGLFFLDNFANVCKQLKRFAVANT